MGSETFNLKMLGIIISLLLLSPTHAASPSLRDAASSRSPRVIADLISENRSFKPGEPFTVALRLIMEDHWHTYWKNAGDSGTGTRIKWKLPDGFQAGPIQWPTPKRIEIPPLTNFGYEGHVLLLVDITPPANLPAGTPVTFSARADWLVCKEICIPEKADLELTIPVMPNSNEAPERDPRWREDFRRTRLALPIRDTQWIISSSYRGPPESREILLRAQPPADSKTSLPKLLFFPYENSPIENALAQKTVRKGERSEIALKVSTQSPQLISRLAGVLVSDKGWDEDGKRKALEIDIPIAGAPATQPARPASAQDQSILRMLLFALLGGLILNLMPCVFPVLSIKVLGFIQQGSDKKSHPIAHAAAFTGGILIAFWALAVAIILLRATGKNWVGWGFQLQSPFFLFGLSSLFLLMGLNLSGLFEIGAAAMSWGGRVRVQGGYLGSFLSGVLATLVATPCSAPFMGTALGYALSQSAPVTLAVFGALGIGMALPYLILSAKPKLLGFLPRPGRWMETFRQFLAFPLYGTVAWLIWIFGTQVGMDGVLRALFGLVIIAMSAWIWGRFKSRGSALFAALLLALGIWTGFLGSVLRAAPLTSDTATVDRLGIRWEKFSNERIAELRAQSKPVFVDFTATWCVTCQVNERLVLAAPVIQNKFREKGVVLMKADWTLYDPVITRALESFGRSGVPLYVLYPRDAARPAIVLPEIVTSSIILKALDQI